MVVVFVSLLVGRPEVGLCNMLRRLILELVRKWFKLICLQVAMFVQIKRRIYLFWVPWLEEEKVKSTRLSVDGKINRLGLYTLKECFKNLSQIGQANHRNLMV